LRGFGPVCSFFKGKRVAVGLSTSPHDRVIERPSSQHVEHPLLVLWTLWAGTPRKKNGSKAENGPLGAGYSPAGAIVFRYRSDRPSARRGLSRERQLLKEDQKKNQSKAVHASLWLSPLIFTHHAKN